MSEKEKNAIDERARVVLTLLAKGRYLTKDSEQVLNAYSCLRPKWKYEQVLRELRKENFIKAVAVFCDKEKNKKDTWTLTKKGTHTCKELGIPINRNWINMLNHPVCWALRSVSELFFQMSNPDGEETAYINASEMYNIAIENSIETKQFHGVVATGYWLAEDDVYPVYTVERDNLSLMWGKEVLGRNLVRKKYRYFTDEPDEVVKRLIVFSNYDGVSSLLNTTSGSKWYKTRNGTYRRERVTKALYSKTESVLFRGEAYALHYDWLTAKDLELYINPERNEQLSNEYLIRKYENSPLVEKFPIIENKTYGFSLYETEQLVVFNLVVQELHKISRILNVLKDGEEKRLIRIITTENQKELSEKIFQGYDCKVLVVSKDKFINR